MNRLLLAALGAALVFAGCAGGDETVVDPTQDPTYLPEHPDHMITFDDNFSDDPKDFSSLGDPPTSSTEGDYGTDRQAFKVCWTGPGFAVKQDSLNVDNVPRKFGPCYQGTEASHDCLFPDFRPNQSVGFKEEIALNNLYCTIGTTAHPDSPGIAITGDIEIDDAATQWRNQSGVNFVRSLGNPSDAPAFISVMCAPRDYQDAHPQVLAAAMSWGPTQLNGTVPQLALVGTAGQDALDANYPLQNPQGRIMYGQGAVWLNDRVINAQINTCGGTLTQRKNKARTLAYLVMLHEYGHIFGFSHTLTGFMKPAIGCPELGDGNAKGPRISIPQIYGDVYRFYSNELKFNAVPSGFRPDPTTPCHQIPIPLKGTITEPESVESDSLN